MDHRWDDRIRQERDARSERERYGARRIEPDESVERRDRIARARPPTNFSPWAIGEAHWDQRDLYTRDARTDDAGYGRGPAVHPDVGSYAYSRDEVPPASRRGGDAGGPSIYEREAWPWLNYHDDEARHGRAPLWSRMKETVARVTGRPAAKRGPKNWRLSDERIREEVCEALAHHGELDASDIEVSVETAEVTLRGTVPDRRSKRLAEHIVEACGGVEDVHNRLEVRRPDDTDANVAFAMPARAFG
jgi:hypothetical protein